MSFAHTVSTPAWAMPFRARPMPEKNSSALARPGKCIISPRFFTSTLLVGDTEILGHDSPFGIPRWVPGHVIGLQLAAARHHEDSARAHMR